MRQHVPALKLGWPNFGEKGRQIAPWYRSRTAREKNASSRTLACGAARGDAARLKESTRPTIAKAGAQQCSPRSRTSLGSVSTLGTSTTTTLPPDVVVWPSIIARRMMLSRRCPFTLQDLDRTSRFLRSSMSWCTYCAYARQQTAARGATSRERREWTGCDAPASNESLSLRLSA